MASMRIIITSAAGNTDRRNACRVTWLKWVKHFHHSLSHSFHIDVPSDPAMRSKINEEAAMFKDIVFINATYPPADFHEACNFRRWEVLANEYRHYGDKIEYFALADDDSFVCIHHLLFDSKF